MSEGIRVPTADPAFARAVRAAAGFGGVDLIEWLCEVDDTRRATRASWPAAAARVNADRGIASDAAGPPDAALRALVALALDGGSGVLTCDVDAVLARPRDGYDEEAQRMARDIIEVLNISSKSLDVRARWSDVSNHTATETPR